MLLTIQKIGIGLDFAIVYEDHNVQLAFDAGLISNKIGAAQADMQYLRDHYFNKPNYIRIDGQPLLLDFGPQTFLSPSEWAQIFQPFGGNKPTFLTLWYQVRNKSDLFYVFNEFLSGKFSNNKHRVSLEENSHGYSRTLPLVFRISTIITH